MKILVVPTIRESRITLFLGAWKLFGGWDEIIIVEDNPTKTFELDVEHHYAWDDIQTDLGENAWIISKRDSAIRSYGLWKAYQLGAEYIFTLDDDCLPIPEQRFFERHIENLEQTTKWTESVPGVRTRGIPYHNKGKLDNVVLSVGLWEGVPDFDAIHMLTDHLDDFTLPKTRVMPIGQYFPICGMNFAFKREVAPLCYFPLMGEGYQFGRFDDIWFGVICKKICDHLGLFITCGEPYIHHSKASCPFHNLVKEAPGIKFHEEFWQIIDAIPLTHKTPRDCMNEIGFKLKYHGDETNEYLKKLGSAIMIWANLFTLPQANET